MNMAILEPDSVELDRLVALYTALGHLSYGATEDIGLLKLLDAVNLDHLDVVLIDWTSPDEKRYATLSRVRKSSSVSIVLCATPQTPEQCIIDGLNAGADINVVKRIGPMELFARVDALVRRAVHMQAVSGKASTFDEYYFHQENHSVEFRGKRICLSAREFDIAILFFRNLSQPVSRRQIAMAMWGDEGQTGSRAINTYVSCVRIKLGLQRENGYSLRAIYGYGYQLNRMATRRL